MKEMFGDIWKTDCDAVCVTTNGIVKKDGKLVMGAGIAKQCLMRYSYSDIVLGRLVKNLGNQCFNFGYDSDRNIHLISFPTKYDFKRKSDIELIKRSCNQLMAIIKLKSLEKVLLPRPGCSNGGLKWEDVKPVISPLLDDNVWVITNDPTES